MSLTGTDPVASDPPNRSADMEGVLSCVDPHVTHTEDCDETLETPSGDTVMTHSSGVKQPCMVPVVGVVGRVGTVGQDEGERVDKMRLMATEETLLLRRSKGGFVRMPFEELEEGRPVKAWASGAISESYPSQEAGAIVVDDGGSGRGGS